MYFFELPTKAYKYPLITLMLASFLSLSWAQDLDDLDLPRQEKPPSLVTTPSQSIDLLVGPTTNLVVTLDRIRDLSAKGELDKAQKLATTALENLDENDQNMFYLRQIKSEETKLYFKLANQAMLDKQYSLASQYIARYRDNVASELEDRKIRRSIKTELKQTQDVSLVGRLVEELDKAKKDLAQIRAQTGLPKDDALPDLDRLVSDEKAKLETSLMKAENLLRKARNDSSQGQYELADNQLDEAL
jgi:hypothetical protein